MNSEEYTRLYGSQISNTRNDNKIKPKKPGLVLTNHAKLRFGQRFNGYGYSMEEIMEDIKKGWKKISAGSSPGKFNIVGKIGKYVITDEMVIVTMFIIPNE